MSEVGHILGLDGDIERRGMIDVNWDLSYMWVCPTCRHLNMSIKRPDENGYTSCEACRSYFSLNTFKRYEIEKIRKIIHQEAVNGKKIHTA